MIEQTYKALIVLMDHHVHEHARIEALLDRIEKEQGWSHAYGVSLLQDARKEEEEINK